MIDETQIGKRIGAGLQHIVYAYGKDAVIKIPRAWMRLSVTYEQKKKRMEIVREHFAEYMLATKVFRYKYSYCYIQKRVFKPDMLKLKHITEGRLMDLIARDKIVRQKHKMGIDFLGSRAFWEFVKGWFTDKPMPTGNIVVDSSAPLGMYLIDDDLIKASPFAVEHIREVVFVGLSYSVYLANKFLIHLYRS